MNKFKEGELIKYFDDMCLFLANHHWTKKDERAIAIREIIQKSTKVIKIDLMIKHVDLIIEGLAKGMAEVSEMKQGTYMQVLIVATFLSFIHDIGMEIEKDIKIKKEEK